VRKKPSLKTVTERKEEAGKRYLIKALIFAIFLLLLKEHTAGDPMDEKVKWTDLTCADISVFWPKKALKLVVIS